MGLGGRGSVGLSHVVLGDYIINMFNDEIHMGRCTSIPSTTMGDRGTICLSDNDYNIIHH